MRHAVLSVLLVACATSAPAATFINAGVNVSTYGYVDGGTPENSSASDVAFTLRPLSASTADTVAGASSALVMSETGNAAFANANRVTFTNVSALGFTTANTSNYGQASSSFFYNFSVVSAEQLTIDYSFLKSITPPPPFGIGGDPARIILGSLDQPPGPPLPPDSFAVPVNTSGIYTRLLAPGRYQIAILSGANGGFRGETYAITGSGRFDIRFGAAVPEPASWAMMIAGFGLAGGAMRRRSAPATERTPGFPPPLG